MKRIKGTLKWPQFTTETFRESLSVLCVEVPSPLSLNDQSYCWVTGIVLVCFFYFSQLFSGPGFSDLTLNLASAFPAFPLFASCLVSPGTRLWWACLVMVQCKVLMLDFSNAAGLFHMFDFGDWANSLDSFVATLDSFVARFGNKSQETQCVVTYVERTPSDDSMLGLWVPGTLTLFLGVIIIPLHSLPLAPLSYPMKIPHWWEKIIQFYSPTHNTILNVKFSFCRNPWVSVILFAAGGHHLSVEV